MGQSNTHNQGSAVHSWPLWRTSWRRASRRPLQYVLLIMGVALGVAMMVSVDIANVSASRAFELSTDAVAGRTTHRIVGGPSGLEEDVYINLKRVLGFEPAAPVVEGYLLAAELGDRPLRMVGVDPFAEPPFRQYFGDQEVGASNGLASFLTEPNAIVISEAVAQKYGLVLGDSLHLDRGGLVITARIVGLLRPSDKASEQALESLIFTDISTAQEIFDMTGRLSHIDLIADASELTIISDFLPSSARIETASGRSSALLQMAEAFELNLTALSLLALVVGMFLIYNTVTFSVVERRRLFGVLRCIGVTGGQLFSMIMAETALLGLVGAGLGLVAGLFLGRAMVSLVSQTVNDFYFVVSVQSVDVPVWTLVKGLTIGVLAAVAAALAPAWEAMRTTPQSSLRRSAIEMKAMRASRWLLLPFVLLTALGGLMLWLENLGLIVTFAGLFTVLIACALVTPALTTVLMKLVGPVYGRVLGTIGRMATRDIVRSLSRTSVAIAALMVAVSVIVGVSIMIGSFRQTVAEWLGSTLQADVYVTPPQLTASRIAGALDREVVDTAQTWPGVDRAVIASHKDIMATDIGRPVEVVAVSGDVSNGQRGFAWIYGNKADLWQRFSSGQGIFVSEPLLLREDMIVPPPPVTLMTESGPHAFPVLAVFYDYSSDQGSILIHQDLYGDWWKEAPATSVGLFVSPGIKTDDIVVELQEQFRGRQDVIVQSNQSLRSNAMEIFDRTFAITSALQLLAVVVAFIGVLSALMSLQLERTRELGMLRATGMTVRQLWQLTMLETGLMGGTAGLMAMPVGWLLAWILIFVINRRSFGWTLQMDLEPHYFLQAFLVAVISALLAAVYPAIRTGRLAIATAIREE